MRVGGGEGGNRGWAGGWPPGLRGGTCGVAAGPAVSGRDVRRVLPGQHTGGIRILVVCTANQCRSPMAAALLRRRLDARGVDATVASAGLLPGGAPATADARAVVAGLDDHVSTQLDADLVAGADLVVAMAREHLREAAVLVPGALAKTFTLKELVRRAERAGPRGPDEPFVAWLARVGEGRRASDLLAEDPGDDVADPIGSPRFVYEQTAAELDGLLGRFVALAWP